MSLVAKQRVIMAGLVRELAHRYKAMTLAPKRKAQRHHQRGFQGFLLINEAENSVESEESV